MAFRHIILILTLGCVSHSGFSQSTITTLSAGEKTTFQTSNPWKPATDVRADVAIVYGTRDRSGLTFEQRVQSWRDKGYVVNFMTGIAWGDYRNYFTGKSKGMYDPIEDRPRDWADYKKNYQATFTAQLLYPMVANYEVMPWPDRIYEGLYKTSVNSDKKERIPRFYSTQMQVMVNSLNMMPESNNKVCGSHGIAVA